MANSALSNFLRRNSDIALDFCVSASFVLALCLFFEPQWESNDDVGMTMVAHGYGIAVVGMPNLIFSNKVVPFDKELISQNLVKSMLYRTGQLYCKERLGGVLNELAAHRYGEVVVSWRRCQSQVD